MKSEKKKKKKPEPNESFPISNFLYFHLVYKLVQIVDLHDDLLPNVPLNYHNLNQLINKMYSKIANKSYYIHCYSDNNFN